MVEGQKFLLPGSCRVRSPDARKGEFSAREVCVRGKRPPLRWHSPAFSVCCVSVVALSGVGRSCAARRGARCSGGTPRQVTAAVASSTAGERAAASQVPGKQRERA